MSTRWFTIHLVVIHKSNTGIQIGGISDNRAGNPSYLVQVQLGYSFCYPYLNFTPLGYQITNSNAILNIDFSDKVVAATSDDSVSNTGHRGGIDGWIHGFSTDPSQGGLSLNAKWKRLLGDPARIILRRLRL
jgi:hypothetical protein